jgi:hypothetical protein
LLVLLKDIPSSDPVDQGDQDIWETVGAAAERSISPPTTTEEAVPGATQQETSVVNSQASAEEARDPPLAATMEQPDGTAAEVEATSEAGIVDIASILGAPTVTVLQSTL